MTISALQHLRTTADRMTETARSMGMFPPPEPPRTTTPCVLRTKAIIRTPEEIELARWMFAHGATFRAVNKATGMSMDKLKKIKEGRV